ncbi:MOSC domain-containing protein [Glutamicibacter sp.]|uniref:MOSC domain-containing protein n=1 Tax=Glutamicibacter sp. TaxID=1931995 RepID=UPI0028BEE75C|nr:MOSC domain-containing protein [Glutamicibacter sp.]
MNSTAKVLAVHLDSKHRFSKETVSEIKLLEGLGVAGDAHAGTTVQHRSRVKADPSQPNLRQIHLIHQELFDWLTQKGYSVKPGELGENVTTTGIDLLGLPKGTLLELGPESVVEVTGLRNPCSQIDSFQHGLLKHLVGYDESGELVRRAGIMGIIHHGGTVKPGDKIGIVIPKGKHETLERV